MGHRGELLAAYRENEISFVRIYADIVQDSRMQQ
jgi:hypothetical protein